MFVGVLKLTRRSTDEQHSNPKPSSAVGETFFERTGHIFGPFGE